MHVQFCIIFYASSPKHTEEIANVQTSPLTVRSLCLQVLCLHNRQQYHDSVFRVIDDVIRASLSEPHLALLLDEMSLRL